MTSLGLIPSLLMLYLVGEIPHLSEKSAIRNSPKAPALLRGASAGFGLTSSKAAVLLHTQGGVVVNLLHLPIFSASCENRQNRAAGHIKRKHTLEKGEFSPVQAEFPRRTSLPPERDAPWRGFPRQRRPAKEAKEKKKQNTRTYSYVTADLMTCFQNWNMVGWM